MSNRWLTKQDILDDLAEVTGSTVTNIDDRFAVRGSRPPPVIVPDEDEDELLQMYSQYTSKNSKIEEPDLPGITHMLRMVNEYYDTAKCDDNETMKELKESANTVISISKLNPNVPEFCPRNVEKNKSETKHEATNGESNNSKSPDFGITKTSSEKLDDKNLVSKNDDEINKTDASQNGTNNNDIDVTKKIDVSKLNSNDIKDISEKLKQKIVSTSKNECLKKKRERNLAMASLLKLYTNIPKSPKNEATLKLMTPEDFQTVPDIPSNPNSGETGTNGTEIDQNIKDQETKNLPNDVEPLPVLDITDPTDVSPSNSKTKSQESSDLSSDKTFDTGVEKQTNTFLMSKEVAESVKKVDKWLNGPEKRKHKSKAVFLGPVTFKRKETSSIKESQSLQSQSPSLSMDDIEKPSSSQVSDTFVPSTYADELTKTYIERSQAKAIQNEDIWTRLERQLQEKDKAIREGKLSAKAQT